MARKPAIDARAEAAEAVRRQRDHLERLKRRKSAEPRDIQAAEVALHGALKLLAKLDGAGEVTVSQILRSAAWKRCSEAILVTARRFPGACEALGKAMRELETQGG